MKKVLYVCVLIGITVTGNAVSNVSAKSNAPNSSIQMQKKATVVTRGDVKIIEATENIRYISQQMTKEYLLLFKVPRQDETRERLKRSLIELSSNLREISATTKDSDTKDILEFLAYSKDQIAQIFTEPIDNERAALMLDYSETLLEGADSIAAAHAYNFTKEEHMLIVTKKMEYLIERMMKYYIALHVGFDNPINKEQMQEAIVKFDENMKQIEAYGYPKEIRSIKSEIVRSWNANKRYLNRYESLFIPKLMLLSTRSMEELTEKIALYHNQNQ
jgi:flagellar motor component MotA